MNNLKSNVPFSFKTSKRVNELSNDGTFALNVERPMKTAKCKKMQNCATAHKLSRA